MRRLFAVMLTAVLLIGTLPAAVYAAAPDYTISMNSAKTVTVSSSSLPGEAFVTVRISRGAVMDYMNQYTTTAGGTLNVMFPLNKATNGMTFTAKVYVEGIGALPEKTFTYSSTASGGDDEEEPSGGGTSGGSSGGSTVTPPPPTPMTQVDTVLSTVNTQTQVTTTQITTAVTSVQAALNSVTTSTQAFETLIKMDDVIKEITSRSTATTAVVDKTAVTAAVTQLSTSIEKKLALIENPAEKIVVLNQVVTEVKAFKTQVGGSTPELNQNIRDMLQKTADAFGTLKVAPSTTAAPVTLSNDLIVQAIQRQAEAVEQLNALQQLFFEENINKNIVKEVIIEVQTAQASPDLKVEVLPDQLATMKNAGVGALTISNRLAEVKLPMTSLPQSNALQLLIEKAVQNQGQIGVVQPGIESPTLSFNISMLVNNVEQDIFSKPLTLGFDLVTFGYQQESPNDLAIFRLNEQTGVWEPVGGKVDSEGGKIFVTRDNLSQYTVLKSKKSFSDADQSWAKAEINALLNKGIVEDSGKFEPQAALTRGEFAQWIAKAYGLKVGSSTLPFKDVDKKLDSYEAIAAVYQQGLLSGKSKTSFDPNAPVTQNELAAALGKLLVSFDNKEKSGKVTSKYLSQLKTTQVASWAEDDMALLMELGLSTSAKAGKDPITKEAAAAAFMKFYRS